MTILNGWNRRKTQMSTWLGISAVFTAAQYFLAGAGDTTPMILEESAKAAENVATAVSNGMDPVSAAIMGGLGVLAVFSDTKERGNAESQ